MNLKQQILEKIDELVITELERPADLTKRNVAFLELEQAIIKMNKELKNLGIEDRDYELKIKYNFDFKGKEISFLNIALLLNKDKELIQFSTEDKLITYNETHYHLKPKNESSINLTTQEISFEQAIDNMLIFSQYIDAINKFVAKKITNNEDLEKRKSFEEKQKLKIDEMRERYLNKNPSQQENKFKA